ncbi:RNA editing complex protein MP46 [Trypanosoma conorhini]|uniref:RNA editing complex protein MP46 n=1 Tax=Trypanosoma conorhini TaxID=83891 RepID=A0A3S5ITW6_9TRYP|nr:RNA editing complex protein MP46 [Trypanosoma conorhini]RNF23766.1 RNA editing complex protein MP46 [Trypanosoma conorhini]
MRRGFTHGVRIHFTAVLLTATRCATCRLCDVEYDSWGKHAAGASHIARNAICRTYVDPERHNAMMQQLWKHIRLDFEYIDGVTHKKEDRRRGRLASTISHLQERGVLCHSIPRLSVDESGGRSVVVTRDAFVNFMLVGDSYAKQETVDRVARLMPRLEAVELSSVVQYILSKRRLSRLFDELDMKQVLFRDTAADGGVPTHGEEGTHGKGDSAREGGGATEQPLRLRQEEKAVILLSCLGELQMYSRQDRSHSVATRAAAEQLVLNVLGTHVMENIIAELVHAVLQAVVEEGTPVWREYCGELTNKVFEGTRATPPPLASSSTPAAEASTFSESCKSELLDLYSLGAEADAAPFLPAAGRRSWHDLARTLALELTVPNPVNKSAQFASAAPRLSSKKKTSA